MYLHTPSTPNPSQTHSRIMATTGIFTVTLYVCNNVIFNISPRCAIANLFVNRLACMRFSAVVLSSVAASCTHVSAQKQFVPHLSKHYDCLLQRGYLLSLFAIVVTFI